jgi:hypothetical protein
MCLGKTEYAATAIVALDADGGRTPNSLDLLR